jgi:hypothetical protein
MLNTITLITDRLPNVIILFVTRVCYFDVRIVT